MDSPAKINDHQPGPVAHNFRFRLLLGTLSLASVISVMVLVVAVVGAVAAVNLVQPEQATTLPTRRDSKTTSTMMTTTVIDDNRARAKEGASPELDAAADDDAQGGGPLANKTGRQQQTKPADKQQQQQHLGAPLIGVITQVFRDYKNFLPDRSLHLPASYVKWLEMAGAQVVPILVNQTNQYYEQMIQATRGLLLPGGDNLLDPKRNTPMMHAARRLYEAATRANHAGRLYPIWGTCLGMELLTVLGSNQNKLVKCRSLDKALNLDQIAGSSRLFRQDKPAQAEPSRRDIIEALETGNVTYNHHTRCITDESLKATGLAGFYRPTAYSRDEHGLQFVAAFEARKYPYYGVQFHPEKACFEHQFLPGHQENIPHSVQARSLSRYFADFFVSQARLGPEPTGQLPGSGSLIYSTNAVYLAPRGDIYEQRYVWPFGEGQAGLDLGEFVDRPLEENESVSEDLMDQ